MPGVALRLISFRPLELHAETKGRPDSYLSRRFIVRIDGVDYPSPWNPADIAAREKLSKAIESIRQGSFGEQELQDASSVLATLLPPETLEETLAKGGRIALQVEGNDSRVLTNLPWEVLRRSSYSYTSGSVAVANCLGGARFSRLLNVDAMPVILSGRLRVLTIFAAPANNFESALPPIDTSPFAEKVKETMSRFPLIDWRTQRPNNPLDLDGLLAEIKANLPHILLLVAHGRSGLNPGEVAEVWLQNNWIPITKIAAILGQFRQTALAALFCCDLAASVNGALSDSAAYSIARAGVPAVLAIQGHVAQDVAANIFGDFLESLLAENAPDFALSSSRLGKSNHLHSFLPTLFVATTDETRLGVVRDRMISLKAAYRVLGATFEDPYTSPFARKESATVSRMLSRSGLAWLSGPIGSGRSSLLATVVRSQINKPSAIRPTVRITSENGKITSAEQFCQATEFALNSAREVLREEFGKEICNSTADFIEMLDRAAVTVIVDEVSPQMSDASLLALFDLAKDMSRSLIVGVSTAKTPFALNHDAVISVCMFEPEETKDFVEAYLPELSTQWKEVYQATGGTPYLLASLASKHRTNGTVTTADLNALTTSLAAGSYARAIVDSLSCEQAVTLTRLLRLDAPISLELFYEFALADFSEEQKNLFLRDLRAVGAIDQLLESGELKIFVPKLKRDNISPLLSEVTDADDSAFLDAVMGRLQPDPISNIPPLFARGGCTILRSLQRILISQSHEGGPDWELAHAIAFAANDGSTTSVELFSLYQPLISRAAPVGIRQSAAIDTAAIAAAGGHPGIAKEILDSIDDVPLAESDKATRHYINAIYLKVTQGVSALPQILDEIDKGLRILEGLLQQPHSPAENEQLKLQVAAAIQLRIDVDLFLARKTADDVASDVRRIEKLLPRSSALGQAYATITERRLKDIHGGQPDWASISRDAWSAFELLRDSPELRRRGYAAYQYAKYLELKPTGSAEEQEKNFEVAAKNYAIAEAAAKGTHDTRREALAAFKRIRIQYARLKTLAPEDALSQSDNIKVRFDLDTADTLSVRALHRLLLLQANLKTSEHLGDPRVDLMRACRLAALLPYGSTRDHDRFKETCRMCFNYLRDINAFEDAQSVLRSITPAIIQHFGPKSDLNEPWRFLDQISR